MKQQGRQMPKIIVTQELDLFPDQLERLHTLGEVKVYRRLAKHPKVMATPHIAYNTERTSRVSNDMMIDNVEAYLKGAPINIVKN